MRKQFWSGAAIFLAAFLAACASSAPTSITGPVLGSAHDLAYVLLPGSPGQASGVLLTWTASQDSNISAFVVNARTSTTAAWNELAITGSTVYFDGETAFQQYFIQTEDASGDVANGPDTITVVYNPPVPAPATITATAFDSAVALHWSDEARVNNPGVWAYYRVFSEPAVLAGGVETCPSAGSGFGLEGTTASEDFVVSGLANGTTWCYAITSVSVLGQESFLSVWATATPNQGGGSFDIAAAPNAKIVVHRARTQFRTQLIKR